MEKQFHRRSIPKQLARPQPLDALRLNNIKKNRDLTRKMKMIRDLEAKMARLEDDLLNLGQIKDLEISMARYTLRQRNILVQNLKGEIQSLEDRNEAMARTFLERGTGPLNEVMVKMEPDLAEYVLKIESE